ncbi:hypothetical protein H0H87_011416 [Tephrocybe sp. NHM501043]|nr:hypothetical protein H0H87_011416 [Tephrocybe sp. NHM501043]
MARLIVLPFQQDSDMFFRIIDEIPYIVVKLNDDLFSDAIYELYRCPIPQFAYEENPDLEAVATEISANTVRVARFLPPSDITLSYYNRDATYTVERMLSSHGFSLIYVTQDDSHISTTHMSFWPVTDIHSLRMEDISPAATIMMEGRVGAHHQHESPWLAIPSRSGAYSMAVVLDHAEQPMLRLIQWDQVSPSIYIRTLNVPWYIDLEGIFDLAIEDRYGVIYLSHAYGYLFALPYA